MKPTQPEIELAKQRAAICESCDQDLGVTFEKGNHPVYTVKCLQCSKCSGLSLIRGKCPLNRWPEDDR